MAVKALVKELWILDPTTQPETVPARMAIRPDTLDGKVAGLLDNSKPNANKILDLVVKLVAKKYDLAGVVRRRKLTASKGAPQELLDEMAEECHFAIVGVGD